MEIHPFCWNEAQVETKIATGPSLYMWMFLCSEGKAWSMFSRRHRYAIHVRNVL